MIDTRASGDIIYWDAFKNLQLQEEDIKPRYAPIMGFKQTRVLVAGRIILLVTLGKERQETIV